MSSPFRQSFDAELLAVPAPERGLAAGASSSSTLGTGCSSWSTGCFNWFLFLLVGVVLNRRLQIAGIVWCVGGSHRCTPLVARDGLGLLVVSSRRRAELPLTVGIGRPELARHLAWLAWLVVRFSKPLVRLDGVPQKSAVGGEIAAMLTLRPKLGRHAAVWGGFNKINKLTRRAAPAPEERGGAALTKDPFVIA